MINVVARQYKLDDKEGIDNPVGSMGYRLEVEATVVTGASSNIQNLTNCILDNGVRIQDLVLEPLASAEAVLSRDELSAGVVLVDMGAGTTDVAIYLDKAPWQTHCLEVGGEYLVHDVSVGAAHVAGQRGGADPTVRPRDPRARPGGRRGARGRFRPGGPAGGPPAGPGRDHQCAGRRAC